MTPAQLFPDLDEQAARMTAAVGATIVDVRSGHGFGAGTIWRPDGLVVTNHHVVPSDHATVGFLDGRLLPGRVVARDLGNDLAVIAVDARDLPVAPRRDARTLRPGEIVYAVGHPFGVRFAVSVGIVAAAPSRRVDRPGRRLIQADLRLGPGNSGGPLVDATGRVVGVNAMVGGGMGLAVPVDLADRLVDALLAAQAA